MSSSKRRKIEKCGDPMNVDEQPKSCHQCRRHRWKGRDGLVECKKCRAHKYCVACLNKWYPNVSEEEFVKACPVCRNNCNCRACLRGVSLKDIQQQYSCSESDKIQYSKYILQNVFPLVRSLNEEQQMEKEIEANVIGLSLSESQLQDAECEVDVDRFCNHCGIYFFDLYWSCACGYDICLVCCRDLREGHISGGKDKISGWKVSIDGSIPCPPKDIGGCDDGILELKRIMPADWVANILEKAQRINENNTSYVIPQVCLECFNDDVGDNGVLQSERSCVSCLYRLSAKDIQPQDVQHFQLHWSKGEPILVSDVLSTSSGLSWEPTVLWRAFHDVTNRRTHSHACAVKAINCLDWSEVTVDLEQFFSGYSDGFLEREGWPVILKLEDWQPFNLAQGQWPRHFVEFISCLPFKDYTYPYNGYLNVAVKGPDLSLKLDIAPKMNVAYGFEEEVEFGDSVTKLRYDKSDSVNLMTHTSTKDQQHVSDTTEGGALWDIFRRQDVPKLEEYLRTHSAEFSHADNLSIQQFAHPIHDRIFYLNTKHKRKLKEEFGIEPWTFKQKLGDAVFIPAGCPYQVKNLKSCTKIELNFVSPESLGECIRLQQELHMLPYNHIAKQQKLNIVKMMIYALEHAVADLVVVDQASNGLLFAKLPEILEGNDANIHNHNNGWLDEDTESDNNPKDPIVSAVPSTIIISSSSHDWSPDEELVTIQDSGTSMPEAKTPHESLGLWQGLDVGLELKELLVSVEQNYPNTFQGVKFRSEKIWLPILEQFHGVVKSFMETSVDALSEERITSLREDLKELERIGFDLSWAHERLNMVEKLKFGKVPLLQELVALDESLEPQMEKINELKNELMKLLEMLNVAKLEYNRTIDARNSKASEAAHEFGAEYDRVLKGHLGFGMLPGY